MIRLLAALAVFAAAGAPAAAGPVSDPVSNPAPNPVSNPASNPASNPTSNAASNPGAEARARLLDSEIRCVVCENEPISQSTSSIAVDMRALVRERIAAGDTDAEIRTFFADRYGEFVLLRPRASALTWPLWAAPLVLLVIAGLAAARLMRRQRDGSPPADDAADTGLEDDR